ncbi:hypothetical protein FKW77_003359 [Venturia effusa]|uniref:HD domain-containing protein n=1 Tax=Venturia effusa TaxID=50376 RepID=A0A517LL53_9PEZI|nr:hypothetical protein FKW77_003359 [Venturia effusa]
MPSKELKQVPTTTIAGITVPNTPLIKASTAYARAHSSDVTYNHIIRSWLFSTIIIQKTASPGDIDPEVYSLSAILHDLGWDSTGTLVSEDKRFEIDGAIAAREFIEGEVRSGRVQGWDEHRKQLVWDTIALHTTPSIAMYKQPVVALVGAGIACDFQGPASDPTGLLTWDEYNAVVKDFPRLDLAGSIRKIICRFVDTKPGTTIDTWMQPYGVKYKADTYTVAGKSGIDMVDNALEWWEF